jgi:hypothetical protein
MNPPPVGVNGVSDMNQQDIEMRINASLLRRLVAAPEELRAMAIAEVVDWQYPDFETNEAQQAAVDVLLQVCSDARAATLGDRADDVWADDRPALAADAALQQWVGTERLIALDRAIAAGVHAGRLLRQLGMKPTLVTHERIDDVSGQTILARANLGFRRRRMSGRAA